VNDASTIEPISSPAVAISGLKFRWRADQPWTLLIPEFTLAAGERLFLAGPSGSGKSTLLALIAGIHPATEGRITLFGTELTARSGSARDRFRADHLGVIFQMFNLLPYLSVLDNVMLPCQFSARRPRPRYRRRWISFRRSAPLAGASGLEPPRPGTPRRR
jgi:putative ABC transport system ATP-binding protein